ncbi:MAG: haloacid dehalogenase, partial [Mucilaginibacter sp.]|nr:haloacid dehalogenase [Mucilaginibacter sp.]
RINFQHLIITAKLPLKLLIYQAVLDILQEIVIDRKKIFIVANGTPALQLNKIKQTEWHGLEAYLTCYFAEETLPMPDPNVLHLLMKEHDLSRRDLVLIGQSEAMELCAEACGVDYYSVNKFL